MSDDSPSHDVTARDEAGAVGPSDPEAAVALAAEPAGGLAPPTAEDPGAADVGGRSVEVPGSLPPALPVDQAERVQSVDVLRGVALLGILAMNIVSFGWPRAVYGNPLRGAGFTGLNQALWIVNHLLFEMKMMTLFSMLFGAGLVLMSDRAAAKGRSLAGVYYRRVLWLLAIGMIHAYFVWAGDILVLYAQCGLLLYPLRNLSARTLMILGVCALLVIVPVLTALDLGFSFMTMTASRAEAKTAAGETLTPLEARIRDVWRTLGPKTRSSEAKAAEAFQNELSIYRGGYWGQVRDRARMLWAEHTLGFALGGLWLVGGRMLLGMGLMKAGVFSNQRSRGFYLGLLAIGYGIGLPLMIYDLTQLIAHRFSMFHLLLEGGIYPNYFGSILVALGHTGLVMLILRAGLLTWLTNRLAAVGRMALSNYLFDSLACTFVFYGWGLGLFGSVDRTGMFAIVLWIWAVQLIVSPIWLRAFRYGPAEWLWRSLTYGRLQPIRQVPRVEALSAV